VKDLDVNSKQEILKAYEFRKQWPPYTYREHLDVTPAILEEYAKFLETENTNGKRWNFSHGLHFATPNALSAIIHQPCSKETI
jgi:hypothetical protein